MDQWKNGSEKKRNFQDLVPEEGFENQMDGKGEKRGGIEKKGLYGTPYAKEEQGGLAT
jgi:hypothetical protein